MKRFRLPIIIIASLVAAALLTVIAYNIAIRTPVPVEYKDLDGTEYDFDGGVFTMTVDAKAGGLYCTGYTTHVKDGELFITITGTPTRVDFERYKVEITVPSNIEKIIYEYKYDNTTLRTIETEED